jgi:hypothetical protein
VSNSKSVQSAAEWGAQQAAAAPSWSDSKWRRISSMLDLDLDESATADSVDQYTRLAASSRGITNTPGRVDGRGEIPTA